MIETAFLFGLATLFLFGIADALAAIPAKRMSPFAIGLVTDSFIFVFFGLISYFVWDTYMWNPYVLLASLSGVIGYSGFLCFIYSLKRGKVGVSAAIANAYPVLVAVFSILVLSELLSLLQVGAILLTVFGIFGLSTKFSIKQFHDHGVKLTSIFLAMGAMLLWGSQTIMLHFVAGNVPPFEATHVIATTTLIVGGALFFASGQTFNTLRAHRRSDLLIAASLGAMYFSGVLTLNYGLSLGSVGVVAAIAGASPLVSALFAYLFMREHLSQKEWFAIVLVVVGLVLLGTVG